MVQHHHLFICANTFEQLISLNMPFSNGIIIFNTHKTRLALYLPLITVIHFTGLSKFFNDLLKTKSQEGWYFWRHWAVENGGIKAYKGRRINYKYKLLLKAFHQAETNVKAYHMPMWRSYSKCNNCGKRCYPDHFDNYYYNDGFDQYCNCEHTDCDSTISMIKRDIDCEERNIDSQKRELLLKVQKLDERKKVLKEKKKKVDSIECFSKMKKEFSNVKENDPYKKNRVQAEYNLKRVEIYDDWIVRVRRNLNYKDQGGRGLGR